MHDLLLRISQFLLTVGSHSSLFQPLYPCFQDLLCLLALLHDHHNLGLHCTLEIVLTNFQFPTVRFASLHFTAQNLQLAAAMVSLSSTAALTEAISPSKTKSVPKAADRERAAQVEVDEDYVLF